MKKRLFLPLALLVFVMGCYLTSCRKSDDDLGPMREFMTSGKISIAAGQTSAVISWKEAVNTDSTTSTYTVQVSKDSTFLNDSIRTYVVSGTSLTVRDTELTIRVPYFVRVKTNGEKPELDSKWVYSAHFSLSGEQIFLPVKEAETKHNSVILHWKDTTGANLIKIVLTPSGGTPTEYPLDPADIDSSYKKIDGLTPTTKYHAQIFSDTKEKGFIDFTTKDVPVYAYTINPGMDLIAVLDTCAPSIIIGLDTGTYAAFSGTCSIKNKSVTLMSVSGNPLDTRIDFKEFKLMGDGAGLTLMDLSFDGKLGAASYFINFAGFASDAAAASFANVSIQNCRVANYGNCLMRGNRGTAAGDHKIGAITVNNSIITNNLLAAAYTEFTLDKMAFQTLTVTNSTFATVGRAILLMSTTLPASATKPVVLFDKNTFNNWGSGGTRALMDANANPVQAIFTNNIFANTPLTGATIANDLFRATGTGTTVTFSNNNLFKLMNGAAAALTIPTTATQTGNQQIDLGWMPTTMDFKLPAGSPLLTASTTGGPIGDPRWVP